MCSLGRNKDLKDWQFKQSVEAIRILFQEIVKPSWLGNVDWAYWEQSAQGLSSNHSTVARDYQVPLAIDRKKTMGDSTLHGNGDPKALGASAIKSFLEELAVNGKVAASTQNQALNALVFFYNQVLKTPVGEIGEFVRAKGP